MAVIFGALLVCLALCLLGMELSRIAGASERIADALEKRNRHDRVQ